MKSFFVKGGKVRLRKKPWIETAMDEVRGKTLFDNGLEKMKGHWQELFSDKSLALEIGCGKGKFIIGMAELHPEKAFIAVEFQHDIAFYPARKALEKKLNNVRVLLADAQGILEWFEEGEIKELYLNFSDPWPKARHAKRRLTHRRFLEMYRKLLGKGGKLRFKTDNRGLFDFSMEEFAAVGAKVLRYSTDLHNSNIDNEVQTEYEERFSAKGNKICFAEVEF